MSPATLPAQVDIHPRGNELAGMEIDAIEYLVGESEPMIKIELFDEQFVIDALLEIEDAERFRDRLDEVIEVAREAEQA